MSASETEGKIWIGVDVGGTKTAVVLSVNPPEMQGRIEFPTLPEKGPEQAIDRIKESIHKLLETPGIDKAKLGGIGVSCGGPLDQATGVVMAPPNLPTWVDVPITSLLSKEFGVPCRLENDANAGAVAEFRFGAGKGTRHMIFLTMGTGLGAGVITDGRLLVGATGQAGEIGHVRLTPSGPVGYNKAGSVEGWASGGGVAQVAREEVEAAIQRGEVTLLAEKLRANGAVTARDLGEAARQGDELAKRILAQTGSRLGEALAILVDLFNPDCIVIGGLAMRMGEYLLGPARETMEREAIPGPAAHCRVIPATLGERIGDVSAICIAMGI
jgi:glucokinase